ncbi:unnamed protein product [Peronospora belbahrii]|uniref:Asn/Gln amidotransferase domain-containing protein n=1 Tax=Peronospora belbahrii TaxID=622444 RepID=A0AAU9L1A0_9STRA|nr:unnamed protein product [Peronospora belbahrii]CAH0520242.1 unnamed protein product [Peronospora belbahrii]
MEPDLRSPLEVGQVMRQLQHLLRHLDVCDGNMEEGSMRCDLNHCGSFWRKSGGEEYDSIRNMMLAVEYEARWQIALTEKENGEAHRETRSFDAATGETKRMRSKEGATDYRFFPEPDLPPLVFTNSLRRSVTECQNPRSYTIQKLNVGERAWCSTLLRVNCDTRHSTVKYGSGWVLNDLFRHLKASNSDIFSCPVQAMELGAFMDLVQDGTISGKIAKDVLEVMSYDNTPKKTPLQIVIE